jgi:GntR family transcriptional regulator of arabinose operon
MMKNGNSQAKYYKLMEFLKKEILMGRIKPGEQIPSENILCKEHSLSRHTVRKAISMLINEGYLYTEHGKGTYCVDRQNIRRDSKNIGVITTYISEYIFPKVIQGIDRVLSGNGYSIILKNTNNSIESEAYCLEDVLGKNVDGLIVEPTKSALFSKNLKFYEALDKHNIPYIFIHGYYQQLGDRSRVVLDDAQGIFSVVEYLTKLGHKNIVGIFKADDIQGIDRHRGFARGLSEAGLLYDPDNVVWYHTEDKEIKPYTVIRQMIEAKKKVDAIVCYNDEIAYKIIEMLGRIGIGVPGDISVTGFDDSYFSGNCPVKITTVSHPKDLLGEEAARILLQMLKNDNCRNNPIQKTIIPELIVKDSCIKR